MTSDLLRLTVLGSATPYPEPDNPCSGYLVASGDTRLWADAGSGTLAQLQQYARLEDLSGIWISHMHADHCADLLTTYYAALFSDITLRAPIPLFGPPGIADRLAHFLTNSPARSPVESAFAVSELYDEHHVQLGCLTLTTRSVSHGMPAFALRVEAGGASLTYSGDTAPCRNLTQLAKDSDALLCEAESSRRPAGMEAVHHTPEEAGATARAAGACQLIVTHVGRSLTPEQAMDRAKAEFPGQVTHAAPGSTFSIGQALPREGRAGT